MQCQERKSAYCIPAVLSGFMMQIPVALSKEESRLSLDGSVGAEYGNDSNVVVEEVDLTTSTSDTFFRLKAKGSAEYQFDKQHSASASLSITDKRFSDADTFDLQTLLFSSGYKYKNGDYTFAFDYRRASAELGGNDFLTLTQMSPSVSFFVNKQNFIRVAYTNIEKELDNNPTRNADSDEYAIDYYFFWKGLNDYFISSVKFRHEDAGEDIFNFSSSQARIAYKKRYELFNYKARLTLEAKYREKDFNDVVNPELNAFRVDKRRSFSVNKEVAIVDDVSLFLDITHINNKSNLPALDYTETIVSTGVEYQF